MIIIAIAGAPGSGKSTAAQKIVDYYGNDQCTIISLDNYYRGLSQLSITEREKQNFDHPDAFDFALLSSHLVELKGGNSIKLPRYNYAGHVKTSESTLVTPTEIIIIEGGLVFHTNALLQHYDVKIYVDTEIDICCMRRLKRDYKQYGFISDETFVRYERNIRPIYFEFISPTKKMADIIIHNNQSSFSYDFTRVLDFISEITKSKPLHRMAPNIINPTFNILSAVAPVRGTLFVISGPSGAGKSTILKRLMQRNLGIEKLVPYTTRPRREAEVDGEDCHFISQDKFLSMLDSLPFLQHIEGFGNHYGMPAPEVLQKLEQGKSLIIDLTPEALGQVLQKVKNVKSIFICPPAMSTILERLRMRSAETDDLEKRYVYSMRMLEQASFIGYDYLIINSQLDAATDALAAIISANQSLLEKQQKDNAALFKRFKLHSILARLKTNAQLDLNEETCEIKSLASLCNSSYRITSKKGDFFLRVLRQSNARYRITSEDESTNLKKVSELQLYPPVIYYDSEKGFYLSQFLETHQILSPEKLRLHPILEDVVNAVRKLHQSILFDNRCSLLSNLESTIVDLKKLDILFPSDIDNVAVICHRVCDLLAKSCESIVPCNNDINPYNILYREDNRNVVISDWECSGNNDPYWDLAKLSVEAHFNEEQDRRLLMLYSGKVTEISLARLMLYKLPVEFQLAIWAKWQVATKNDSTIESHFEKMFLVRLDNCRKHISSLIFAKNIAMVKDRINSPFLLPRRQFSDLKLPNAYIEIVSRLSPELSSLTQITQSHRHPIFKSGLSLLQPTPCQSISNCIERTFAIIKTDIFSQNKIGEVLTFLERSELSVIALKLKELTFTEVEALYPKMAEQDYQFDILDLMTSGPVAIVVLEGVNATKKLLGLKGDTDPRSSQVNTLRKLFGTDVKWNAIHCSDSLTEAEREIALFFNPEEIYSRSIPLESVKHLSI